MYFIKMVSRGTSDNKNFVGDVAVSIYGKNEKLLAYTGSHAEHVHMVMDFKPWFGKEYGYKRKCDARRSWVFKNPENSKYWESEVSIVWMDC